MTVKTTNVSVIVYNMNTLFIVVTNQQKQLKIEFLNISGFCFQDNHLNIKFKLKVGKKHTKETYHLISDIFYVFT